MGKEFGKLQRLYGINYYFLSPYEMRPYAGMFKPGLSNTLRRMRESAPLIIVPVVLIYTVIHTALESHEKSIRKNPLDYECDV